MSSPDSNSVERELRTAGGPADSNSAPGSLLLIIQDMKRDLAVLIESLAVLRAALHRSPRGPVIAIIDAEYQLTSTH